MPGLRGGSKRASGVADRQQHVDGVSEGGSLAALDFRRRLPGFDELILQGARAIEDGIVNKDGKLPINPSGGLKSKGHPIGATGVSMHALAAMQLTGSAGDMQVKDARLGGIFNMGGTAVANYVSILERLR